MSDDAQPNVMHADPERREEVPSPATPQDAVRRLQRERDHLLVLHEAIAEAERAPTMEDKLRIFVQAVRGIGFGRATITLRDAELNATHVVSAGLTTEEEQFLRAEPVPGAVWRRRLAQMERFRLGGSFYLDGRDPWVIEEFGDALPSLAQPADDPAWSPRDMLIVPLRRANGEVGGTLVLDESEDRRRPSLQRVRIVELFAQQVSAMIEQAALVALAERRARRLQKLHEVGSLLARSLDEPTILRALARQVESIVPVSAVAVLSIADDGSPQPRVLRRDGVERDEEDLPPIMRSLAAVASRAGRVTRERAIAAVPCMLDPNTLAVLVVEHASGDPVEQDDVELLRTIGAQAGAALYNARLYAESLRQRRETEALADVARAVGESLRIDKVLQLIVRHATALLRTDGATLGLLRGDSLEITAAVGAGMPLLGTRLPLHGSMSGRAVRTASSIIGADVPMDPDAHAPTVEAANIRNTIIVPMLSVQGPVGMLTVINREAPFTPNDADVLQRLADQVAVAVVNARLFEEVAEATREWAVAFDSIGSGMVVLDRAGRIQRSNATARRLMGGIVEEALLGKHFHTMLFGDEEPCDACVHLAAINEGAVRRGTHDDRTRARVFDVTAAPHPLGGAVVTFDDVTEHRSLAERHRRVVETARDAIVITDRERRISFANPAAHELLGRGAELIGMPTERTVPEEQRTDVRRREELAFSGEPQRYEGVVVRPDGDRRIVAISTAPLTELGEVTGVVASLRDVTDERRARDAVALSESRYRNLFDTASDAIYTLDLHGAFTSVNEATCTLSGRSRDELLGHTSRAMMDDDEVAMVAENFGRALTGEAVRYECHLRRADGSRRILSVTNTPIRRGSDTVGVLGIARDMTDARERAAALERSEARYTRLVESASDAIFTMDEDGRFTAVNRSLEKAVGRTRQELVGASFSQLVHGEDLPAAHQLLRETYQGERSRGSVRYRDASGELRHGSVITSPILDGGQIVGALGIMRDVTDEHRLAEQLLQQEKLAAVGQLVSGVAHELNNPLAGVMAFAQLLLASPGVSDEPRRAVETIHREAQRAAKIVTSLLTFARQQPAERSAVQLNDIVQDTLELRRYALRTAGVEVALDLQPDLPKSWADPFQLQQVVLNLFANAEQALAETTGPRRVRVATRMTNATLVLEVYDNGPGIPAELRDRIFNPFFTTKRVGQGTGLGLSISDGIVREHGGRILVEASPEGGAAFIVELPFVAPPAPQKPVEPRTSPRGTRSRFRMLVVDDEPAMRTAMAGFLASLGHSVEVAPGGLEARALLDAGEYDVVLLDLRMPGLGGEALYRELQERESPHASRVVFVTGDLQSESSQRFLSEAGRPVIGKPFQLDDLAAVITGVTT